MKEEKLVIILTAALAISYLPTAYDDIDQFAEYVDIAASRGVPLVVVNLVCDLGANSERLCSRKGTQGNGKAKLVDVDVLKRIRRATVLLDRERVWRWGSKGISFTSS